MSFVVVQKIVMFGSQKKDGENPYVINICLWTIAGCSI
jgi:hypothetical protein